MKNVQLEVNAIKLMEELDDIMSLPPFSDQYDGEFDHHKGTEFKMGGIVDGKYQ